MSKVMQAHIGQLRLRERGFELGLNILWFDRAPERSSERQAAQSVTREISRRLIKSAGEIPSLIERLTDVLELPSLTEPQVVAIESFTERIGSLNATILRTVNAEDAPLPYEQSLASTNRLGEEIATAMVFLDRLLLDPRGN